MIWNVSYSDSFWQDLKEIASYISEVLQEPSTAEKQVERILDATDSLEHMPERHRVYDGIVTRKPEVRFFPVDNYIIFYQPVKTLKIVKILRVIYGGRDIGSLTI